MKHRVLFLCTYNACRSQMAEGLLRHDLGSRYEVFSAGTEATSVNPRAIQSMAEIGIDISSQYSKTLDHFAGQPFDCVVTLCGHPSEQSPLFVGGVERMHVEFGDPSRCKGSEEEIMAEFRRVRDAIRLWLNGSFGGLLHE